MTRKMKPVRPIEWEGGKIKRLNLAADQLNDDWIRSSRLKKQGKNREYNRLDGREMYEEE